MATEVKPPGEAGPPDGGALLKELKITVEHSDMPEEMQEHLKEIVLDAFNKHTVYKDLATSIKQVRQACSWHNCRCGLLLLALAALPIDS